MHYCSTTWIMHRDSPRLGCPLSFAPFNTFPRNLPEVPHPTPPKPTRPDPTRTHLSFPPPVPLSAGTVGLTGRPMRNGYLLWVRWLVHSHCWSTGWPHALLTADGATSTGVQRGDKNSRHRLLLDGPDRLFCNLIRSPAGRGSMLETLRFFDVAGVITILLQLMWTGKWLGPGPYGGHVEPDHAVRDSTCEITFLSVPVPSAYAITKFRPL
jgi:hypothetical protein